jgi:hypothetical protein
LSSQRYSVTPHAIDTLLSWVKTGDIAIQITNWANTSQTGVDVAARKGQKQLHVEAKGITSSKSGSNRFEKSMTTGQLKVQVGMALWKTAELRSANPNDEVAIALPDEERLRLRIKLIEPALAASRIGVIWVDEALAASAWNVDW